jgi:hypothetical protein
LVYEKKRRKLKNTFYETIAVNFAIAALLATLIYSLFWPGCKRKGKRVQGLKKRVNRSLSSGKLMIKQKLLLRSMVIKINSEWKTYRRSEGW